MNGHVDKSTLELKKKFYEPKNIERINERFNKVSAFKPG